MENSSVSDKNQRKKRKRYYRQGLINKRAKFTAQNSALTTNKVSLQDHLKGFLITCNRKEYQCLQECYNILNEISEKMYPDCPKVDIDPNDIEACIRSEITKQYRRAFVQVKTNCKNLLFIRIIDDDDKDPEKIILNILDELEKTQKQIARYIQRIIPVINTCKAEKILEYFEQIFEQRASKKVCSYSVQCRIRNNSSFKEKTLQEQIIEIVREKRPNWYVDLNQPDQLIQINIVCKAGCISILKDYYSYSKYNLNEFLKKCLEITKNKTVDQK